ncbi:MAG: hypothetical protein WBG50_23600 [Desulfomonilaceae bacterium]
MLRLALFLSVMVLFLSGAGTFAQFSSSENPEKTHPCPQSPLQASKLAAADVAKFKKMYYSGTWTGFIYQFNKKYPDCPPYIKRVYLDTARPLMNAGPPQVGSFQNSLRK